LPAVLRPGIAVKMTRLLARTSNIAAKGTFCSPVTVCLGSPSYTGEVDIIKFDKSGLEIHYRKLYTVCRRIKQCDREREISS
jgi:hypothetical protein